MNDRSFVEYGYTLNPHNILRRLKFAVIFIVVLFSPTLVIADVTVDLRVLVISTGTPSEDLGLDMIDDTLQQIGIPYDVLDSRRDTLTEEKLFTSDHGFYNGIIVTNSELFILNDPNNPEAGAYSGFTPDEWIILQNYERSFSIRESVLSGFPAAYPDYGLEYAGGGNAFNGTWLAPAGGTELFEYINTANPFVINDWAFLSRAKGSGPQVQPLLVDNGDTNRILIALLTYEDGREVLFSGISNAWYLIHSQALAYEFINFATKGVFIGGRQVYFAAHVDDFFTSDDLWNPETNMTEETRTFRMSGAELENTLAAQIALGNQYSVLNNFKLDMAFNGNGAILPINPDPNLVLPSIADTYLEQDDPNDNNGNKSDGSIAYTSGVNNQERMLIRFEIPSDSTMIANTATLNLSVLTSETNNESDIESSESSRFSRFFSSSDDSRSEDDDDDRDSDDRDDDDEDDEPDDENPGTAGNLDAIVCRVTRSWREGNGRDYRNATWNNRRTNRRWSNSGGDYDANSCISFKILNSGPLSVDITPIVNSWLSGQSRNRGLIILATNNGEATIYSREAAVSQQPILNIELLTNDDSLTRAVIENANAFRYINHTFSHLNMDLSAGPSYDDVRNEIEQNREIWQQLGLPEYAENIPVLVSGNHSGLKDQNGTDLDPNDDIQYPEGKNDVFLQAAQDAGVVTIASDSSQINQDIEGYIPGFELILSPRRPSALFYNVTTPEEWTDEYNYIFYERYIEQGLNPCVIPGAICQPRNFNEILSAEADWTFRQLLRNQLWPNFFHQSNLHDYDGQGSTLLFDWIEAVISRYNAVFNLPIINLPYYTIGEKTKDRIAAANANIAGVWNLTTNMVTLTANTNVKIDVTGISNGEIYGGQSIRSVSIGATPQSHSVDRKLSE